MSAFEIIIHEHEGPVSSSTTLILPTTVDLPEDDPRTLLYMLDSELEQLELEEELHRRVVEEKERREAASLLEMMLEEDMLLDALGRRTLAIAGIETAPIFYEPFFGYVTMPQSTSQSAMLEIEYYDQPMKPSTSAQVHRSHDRLRAAQQHARDVHRPHRNAAARRPAFYAHEMEPKHVREYYEDRELDWLARELLNASRPGAQMSDVHSSGKPGVPAEPFGGGHVYVIDDGSVGDAADKGWTEDEGEENTPSYQVEQYDEDEDEGEAAAAASGEKILIPPPKPSPQQPAETHVEPTRTSGTESTAPSATTATNTTKMRAATVIDEEEEQRLETEGIPAEEPGPPRKTAKVQR